MKLVLDESEIIRLYIEENLNISQIAKHFNVNHGTIKLRLVKNNIPLKSFKQIQKEAMNRPDVKKKVSDSAKKSHNKRKDTNIKKYGSEVPANNTDIKNRWLKNVDWDKRNKKIIKTCLDKYGVDNVSKSDNIKEKIKQNRWKNKSDEELNDIKNKTIDTFINNYGVDNPLKNNEIKEQVRKSRWGDKSEEDLKEIKKRTIKTFFTNNKSLKLSKIKDYNVELVEEYKGIKNLTKIKCTLCNNIYETIIEYVLNGYGKCPNCYPKYISSGEKELFKYISSVYNNKIICNSRNIIKPLELDIYIPDLKLAIEYNGIYYHSEKFNIDENYHLNKTLQCKNKNIRLIHIFEDEWVFKQDIVKSRLLHILKINKSKRIHARKCNIKEIDSNLKNKFLNKFHIQGNGYVFSINLGAFYDDNLISVMTFSKPSIAKGSKNLDNSIWELNRFCSNPKYHIPGIASKLLKYFQRNYEWKEIFSYADRRWSNGNLYKQLGFNIDHITKPNYWYVKSIKRIHRFSLRKKKDDPKHLSERIIRRNEGYYRIWDCGNYKFNMLNE